MMRVTLTPIFDILDKSLSNLSINSKVTICFPFVFLIYVYVLLNLLIFEIEASLMKRVITLTLRKPLISTNKAAITFFSRLSKVIMLIISLSLCHHYLYTHFYAFVPVAGPLDKLKVDQCKIYLRKHGLRLTGKKDILVHRINEHLEYDLYPPPLFLYFLVLGLFFLFQISEIIS